MSENNVVYIVHSIDTEGPLYESLEATFGRLKELYGITNISPTRDNLTKLQKGKIDLGGKETKVAETLQGHLLNYHDTWDKIDVMRDRIMADEFRNILPDSFGGGWIYNWHCIDHVGYENNPRRRDIGYHNIYDHYKEVIDSRPACKDEIHWHFHPMSTYRDAHRSATSYVNSSELYQILCRRIIERNWFPTINRAGFHAERPDSHWFLEQWIPFDISNSSFGESADLDKSVDCRNGRMGDWRLAPTDWSIYNPSHDNYQLPGSCRRWIARSLAVLNRVASIDQREMDKAFCRAKSGKPTIVGISSHDFRDLGVEVDFIRDIIARSSHKYPDVKFKYAGGMEAFNKTIWPEGSKEDSLDFEIVFHSEKDGDVPYIEVITKKGKVFGPQPFLAIKTRSRRFIHDNFDFSISLDRWYYPFYANTLPLDDVAEIGVAANDKFGNVCIKNIDFTKICIQ